MGTTVSTNLGLIKPDINESIKENLPTFAGWADQNADNMDTIDSLFRADNNTYSIALTGSVSNPVLGTGGTINGKYVRIFPRMVIVYFRLQFGVAGFAAGSGEIRVDLPFAMDPVLAASDGGGRLTPIGKAIYRDNGTTAGSSVFTCLYSPIPNLIVFGQSQGGTVQATYPLESSDRLSGYFMYPTAAA